MIIQFRPIINESQEEVTVKKITAHRNYVIDKSTVPEIPACYRKNYKDILLDAATMLASAIGCVAIFAYLFIVF